MKVVGCRAAGYQGMSDKDELGPDSVGCLDPKLFCSFLQVKREWTTMAQVSIRAKKAQKSQATCPQSCDSGWCSWTPSWAAEMPELGFEALMPTSFQDASDNVREYFMRTYHGPSTILSSFEAMNPHNNRKGIVIIPFCTKETEIQIVTCSGI